MIPELRPNTIHVGFTLMQVQPPGRGDELTPEEEEELRVEMEEWTKTGHENRFWRAIIFHNLSGSAQYKAIHSPAFHKDDGAGMVSARNSLIAVCGEAIAAIKP